MKRRTVLLGAIAFAGAMAAPVAHAQEVTLDVLYAFPAFAKFHEPIAQEFMKRHPDIKIAFRAPAVHPGHHDDRHQVTASPCNTITKEREENGWATYRD